MPDEKTKNPIFKHINSPNLLKQLEEYEYLFKNNIPALRLKSFLMSSGEGPNDGHTHLRMYGMLLLNVCDKLDTMIELLGGKKASETVVSVTEPPMTEPDKIIDKLGKIRELTTAELILDLLSLCPATMDVVQSALSNKKSKGTIKLAVYDLVKKKKIEKVKIGAESKFRIIPLKREMEKVIDKSLTE